MEQKLYKRIKEMAGNPRGNLFLLSFKERSVKYDQSSVGFIECNNHMFSSASELWCL